MKLLLLLVALALTAPAYCQVQFVTTNLPDVEVGQSYDKQIVVSGATGTPTFGLGFGAMPEGLSIDANGRITGVADHTVGPPLGTSTSPNNANGSRTYSFQVNCVDGSTLIQRYYGITLWAAGAMPSGGGGGSSSDSGGCSTGASDGDHFLWLIGVLAVVSFVRRRTWDGTALVRWRSP
ncbi:MAG: hypothetical protein KF754_01685 [Planctomycetes bacterium]|nr:hypothetical protein [Planctomycetota bacterium]